MCDVHRQHRQRGDHRDGRHRYPSTTRPATDGPAPAAPLDADDAQQTEEQPTGKTVRHPCEPRAETEDGSDDACDDPPPQEPRGGSERHEELLDRCPPCVFTQPRQHPACSTGDGSGGRRQQRPHAMVVLRHRGVGQPCGRSQLLRIDAGRAEAHGQVRTGSGPRPAGERVCERVGQVRLKAVGQVFDLLGRQADELASHGGRVRRNVGEVVLPGRGRRAHRASSVSSRPAMVPANSCQSLRCVASIARPCAFIP